MNKFFVSAGLATCIAMAATAAEARPPSLFGPGGGLNQLFALADANHDGVVDQAEIDALRAERFEHIDTNGDGVLSDSEIKAVQDAAAEVMRDMIVLTPVVGPEFFMNIMGGGPNADTNGDGEISRDEFVAARGRMFERVDANHDGNLTEEEVRQARNRHEPREARDRRDPRRMPPEDMGDRRGGHCSPGGRRD